MNKSEIAGRVADRIGVSRSAAGDAVDAVFEAVSESLANGEELRIVGFGIFGARSRPARTGRNPQTGESLSIQASTAPVFKPGKARDGRDVESGRFRCDDGDPGGPVAMAGEIKQAQWVDGRLPTPLLAR